MRTLALALLVSVACILAPAARAPANPKVRDDIVGAIWRYTLKRPGQVDQTGEFRIFKGDVYLKDKKVGVFQPKDDTDSTLTIGGLPELNGTATLKKIKKKPVTDTGKFKKTDGTEWEITLVVVDR